MKVIQKKLKQYVVDPKCKLLNAQLCPNGEAAFRTRYPSVSEDDLAYGQHCRPWK